MKRHRRWTTILLTGIGVSSIGDFVYLVALNVFVLHTTGSAAAVAGLWVVGKVSALVVGPWAGSVTDRFSHRRQLIVAELLRAGLVGLLATLQQVAGIYLVLFLLGVCGTFFNNAFLPYQTQLVPPEHRKRVNALASTLRSGAFIVGPAVAGVMLQAGSATAALWVDAASFLVSAVTLLALPDFGRAAGTSGGSGAWSALRRDWGAAMQFLKDNVLFTALFTCNALALLAASAADAQEVVFAEQALNLGAFGYGMMVTAAGVGFVTGSLLVSAIANRLRTEWLLGAGSVLSATGYLTYALAHGFWTAVTGLVVLGVFGSLSSVGFTTYMQHAVPVAWMGRINNVLGPVQQVLSIGFILAGGALTAHFGVRSAMVGMTIVMCAVSVGSLVLVSLPHNRRLVSAADGQDQQVQGNVP
ncbi:MFS transporter [Alicyclobacillus macrosporangiidus]|uniref:Predicted arabinose efflux permease, MFS family n=1 Tax=Alicyclobacillus macrosporangiidus TaxID=392015 RepID=A0A1I7KUR1_9BACL|nr:MFS transporter [Alicyclobacillus macrosporangiidus]SFV01239.1 Predicted arabinose efflux permease, MFS family [Alicyclobacillus macrosporangiidus]